MNVKTIFITVGLFAGLSSLCAFAADKSLCREDWALFLYDNGNLKSCNLKNDYDSYGITCKNDYPVTFYVTGELQSCRLSEDTTVNGITCRGDRTISFYPDGRLSECVKAAPY